MTVLLVEDTWKYGTIYGNYAWFYLSVGMFSIVTCFVLFVRKNSKFHFVFLDGIVVIYYVYMVIHFFILASESVSLFVFINLLFVCYFNFRLWFSLFPQCLIFLTLGILVVGLIELVWGFLQLYGFVRSYHMLFPITGSFFNPGPYAGFVAVVLPVALNLFIKEKNRYIVLFSLICLLAGMIMLPCTMSRSAWISVIIACSYILFIHFKLNKYLYNYFLNKRFKSIIVLFIVLLCLSIVGYLLFYIKRDSANGRFLIWKLSSELIFDNLYGVGLGGFSNAYGLKQADFFISGRGTLMEEYVAGNPSYGFNDFLQMGVEYGVIGLAFLFLLFVIALYYAHNNEKQNLGFSGALIALSVFRFFSYPFSILSFVIYFVFFLAATVSVYGKSMNDMLRSNLFIYKIFFLSLTVFALIILYYRLPQYRAIKEWNTFRYNTELPVSKNLIEHYQKLYLYLNDQVNFLFEYGKILENGKYYNDAINVYERAKTFSCDPMFYNLSGKCYQALKQYEKAEECLLTAHYIVPSRIYPCYLLANLYFERGFMNKALYWAEYVKDKDVKIKSRATDDMKDKMNFLILKINELKLK